MKRFDKNWCFLPSSPRPAGHLTLGKDDFMKKEGHPEFSSGSAAWVVSRGFTLIEFISSCPYHRHFGLGGSAAV